LWYVNGHHHIFAERSLLIHKILSNFVGYNQPEKSKHKKRSTTSNQLAGTRNGFSPGLLVVLIVIPVIGSNR